MEGDSGPLPAGEVSFSPGSEVLNTEVPLASVGTHVQEYTRAPVPLYSGRSSLLGFGKPLEGGEHTPHALLSYKDK